MTVAVFPKKRALTSAILTLSLIVGLLFGLYEGLDSLKYVHQVEIPILEMTSISLNLEDRVVRRMEVIAFSGDKELIENALTERDALDEHLKSFNEEINKLKSTDVIKVQDRKELAKFEDQIIHLVKTNQHAKAIEIVESSEYQSHKENFKEYFQDVAESLAMNRDLIMANKTRALYVYFAGAFAVLFMITLMWYAVLKAYAANVEAKAELEAKLEAERVRSINSSKLVTLGEMAGGIAHEINNPLAIINGYATQLLSWQERAMKPEDMQTRIKKIIDTTQRIAKIVQGLRAFSRDAQADPFTPAAVNVIVTDSIELVNGQFKRLDVQLKVKVPEQPIMLSCRQVQVSQVILNLLTNALDAAKDTPEKWVELEVQDNQDQLAIIVTDSGSGIPAHVADKMFQPFFTTKDVGAGTGLGLSISIGLAKDHGGSLVLDRKHPHTRFVFTLPKSQLELKAA